MPHQSAALRDRQQFRADHFAGRGKRWAAPGVHLPTPRQIAEHIACQEKPGLARRLRGERKRARRRGVAPRKLVTDDQVKHFAKVARQLAEAAVVTKDTKARLKTAAEGR